MTTPAKLELSKLNNFVLAFGAARTLIQKANKEGNLLEGLVLYATLSDGFLRIGLVLKRQIVKKNSVIDTELISQEKSGKFYTERQIQQMALNECVIVPKIFDELSFLYGKRNDAIHKFFLTDLTYSDLPPILERYEVMYKKLNQLVWNLEDEQIRMGVGMSMASKNSAKETLKMLLDIARKIDPSMPELHK
jgi:hypothetical protein